MGNQKKKIIECEGCPIYSDPGSWILGIHDLRCFLDLGTCLIATLIYVQTLGGRFGGAYISTCMLRDVTYVLNTWLNVWVRACTVQIRLCVWDCHLTQPCFKLWLHLSVGARLVGDWRVNKQTNKQINSKQGRSANDGSICRSAATTAVRRRTVVANGLTDGQGRFRSFKLFLVLIGWKLIKFFVMDSKNNSVLH